MRTWWTVIAGTLLLASGWVGAQIPKPTDSPQPRSPAESKKCFTLPEGFRIDLVASEPLIRDPSCVAWDEKGRLFVTEIHGYNLEGHLDVTALNKTGKLDTSIRRVRVGPEVKAQARRGQTGSLKLLRDRDADGRMDEVIVWAEDIPSAYGVVAARGGVVVMAEPDIYFFADTDGDDRPDVRERIFTGFERGEMERSINNPVWGPDNWIYAGRGWGGATVTGPNLKGAVKLGRTDFRFKPDGSAIEPVSGDNHTFGMCFDDFGFRFLITTGQPVRYAVPLPYRYLARNPHVPSPGTTAGATPYHNTFPTSQPHPWRRKRGADQRWVKFYGSGEAKPNGNFTSACGQQVYRADLFPAEYHGNHFACEPQQNMVHRSLLERDGPGLRAERPEAQRESEFLSSSDGWFRPNNLRVGPDGALYVIDMYREIIEDYSAIPRYLQQQYGLLRGDDRGRIWRVAPAQSAPAPIVAADNPAAPKYFVHPNAWWRETAQRLSVEAAGGDPVAGPLLALAKDPTTSFQGRIHAIYALAGRNELSPGDTLFALADSHPAVRLHALRLSEQWLDESPETLRVVVDMAEKEKDPSVLLQLALSLGESKSPQAVEALARLATARGDVRWMETAVLSSIGPSAGAFLTALLERDSNASSVLVERATETAVRSGDQNAVNEVMTALTSHPDEALGLRLLAIAAANGLDKSPALQAGADTAMGVALDDEQPAAKRLAALRLAPYASAALLKSTVEKVIDPLTDPEFQEQALQAITSGSSEVVAVALIESVPRMTQRSVAIVTDRLLGSEAATRRLLESKQLTAGSFSSLQKYRLLNHGNEEIKTLARELFSSRASDPGKRKYTAHFAALQGKGDPKRGSQIYTTHCAACHSFSGSGHAVGPALDGEVGRPAESLLLDILDPGQSLTAGYATFLAKTKNGDSYAGVLSGESATSVTLTAAGGVRAVVLRADLASIEKLDLSLMPLTFADALKPQDTADLLAYLKSRPTPRSLVLFDEDPGFPRILDSGRGSARLDRRDGATGQASLTVSGFQRFSRQIPGWKFAIREKPAEGEFRFLRIAMKTRGSQGMMLELAADQSFPPESEAIRTYYAGKNLTGWKSNRLAEKIPADWQSFTIDLWKGNGEFNLTGMAFTVMNGEASYDRIELLREIP